MPSPLPHTGMWKSAADSFAFKQVVESIKGTDACVYLKFLQLSGFKHHCETSITFYNTSLDRGLGLLIHFWFKSFDICLWKAWQVELNHLLAYRRLLSWKDGSLVKWFLNPHNTLRGSKLQKQIVAFYTHTAWWLEAHIAGRLLQSDCLMPSSPKLPLERKKKKKKILKSHKLSSQGSQTTVLRMHVFFLPVRFSISTALIAIQEALHWLSGYQGKYKVCTVIVIQLAAMLKVIYILEDCLGVVRLFFTGAAVSTAVELVTIRNR